MRHMKELRKEKLFSQNPRKIGGGVITTANVLSLLFVAARRYKFFITWQRQAKYRLMNGIVCFFAEELITLQGFTIHHTKRIVASFTFST